MLLAIGLVCCVCVSEPTLLSRCQGSGLRTFDKRFSHIATGRAGLPKAEGPWVGQFQSW